MSAMSLMILGWTHDDARKVISAAGAEQDLEKRIKRRDDRPVHPAWDFGFKLGTYDLTMEWFHPGPSAEDTVDSMLVVYLEEMRVFNISSRPDQLSTDEFKLPALAVGLGKALRFTRDYPELPQPRLINVVVAHY